MKWQGGAATRELWLEDSRGLGGGSGLAPLGLRAPPSGASAKRVQGCSAREVLPDSQGLLALLRPAKLGKSFSKGGCSSMRRHLRLRNMRGKRTCDCRCQCCWCCLMARACLVACRKRGCMHGSARTCVALTARAKMLSIIARPVQSSSRGGCSHQRHVRLCAI